MAAKVPSKHTSDQPQDFEGLLSNLQDWELSFKEKDKKLRSDTVGKGKLDHPVHPSRVNADGLSDSTNVNGKQTLGRTSNTSAVRQYDYLKDFEALSRLSSGDQLQKSFVDANSEKELGNEYFKQKKFNEAIDCYSRSIALSPTAVAYANRAMAYIKIKRFQEAENDCTEALNLDDRYIKAYSRRSTARKELRKLKESIDDAEFALRLEPQNQEIKKQYAEAKSLFEKEVLKKASGSLAESMERLRPVNSKADKIKSVQELQSASIGSTGKAAAILEDYAKGNHRTEVAAQTSMEVKRNSVIGDGSESDTGKETAKGKPKSSKQDLGASVHELATKAANLVKADAAKNIVPPNSAYQFEVSWRGLSGDRSLQARLLKVTPPTALPRIFKNALSAPMLVEIIRCIATFFMEDMALSVEYLQNLTKIPRFDMLIMCLCSGDKADILKIWDEVFSKGATDYAQVLGDLRTRYGVKQYGIHI